MFGVALSARSAVLDIRLAFSPYSNASCLVPLGNGLAEEWILYCSCGRPPISSRWTWNELKLYVVSKQAHDRGYGPPGEIVPVGEEVQPNCRLSKYVLTRQAFLLCLTYRLNTI